MQLFFESDIENNGGFLNEIESHHCIKVLRHKKNDIITIIDGKGSFLKACITEAHPKNCQVQIIEKEFHQPKSFKLHIAIAPTKNIDRTEWFLEKATEIGIHSITPIFCSNSERKNIKSARLEKVIVSATKQSLSPYMPILNDSISFTEFISKDHAEECFIAHCEEAAQKHQLKDSYLKNKDVLILIGPEGDFSKEEIEKALKNNFSAVSLGNSRLRTETAGVVACHTINLINT